MFGNVTANCPIVRRNEQSADRPLLFLRSDRKLQLKENTRPCKRGQKGVAALKYFTFPGQPAARASAFFVGGKKMAAGQLIKRAMRTNVICAPLLQLNIIVG